MDKTSFLVCDEKDWDGLNPDQRTWMLYKTMLSIEKRLTVMEHQSFIHKACAAAGGFVGGAMAAVGIKWWS